MAKKKKKPVRTTDDPAMLRRLLEGSTEVIHCIRDVARKAERSALYGQRIAFDELDQLALELIALIKDRKSAYVHDLTTDVTEALSADARLSLLFDDSRPLLVALRGLSSRIEKWRNAFPEVDEPPRPDNRRRRIDFDVAAGKPPAGHPDQPSVEAGWQKQDTARDDVMGDLATVLDLTEKKRTLIQDKLVDRSATKRSWTAPEVDKAVNEYRSQTTQKVRQLKKRIEIGGASEIAEAQSFFGKNTIARKLGAAPSMVSKSQAWRDLAEHIGIPHGSKANRKDASKVEYDNTDDSELEADIEQRVTALRGRADPQELEEIGRQYRGGEISQEDALQQFNALESQLED